MMKIAFARLAGASALVLMATACTTTVSRGVNDEGVASEVVFPETSAAWLPEGINVSGDTLRELRAGMSKDQLARILGSPHFNEGPFAVREWDYVLNVRHGQAVTHCQFKVLFDKDYTARRFHWKPDNCAGLVAGGPAPAERGTAAVSGAILGVPAIPAVQAFVHHPAHCLGMLYVVENQTPSEAQAYEVAAREAITQIRGQDAGLSDFAATLQLKSACDAQAATGYFGTGSIKAASATAAR